MKMKSRASALFAAIAWCASASLLVYAPDETIISRIRDSGSVFQLTSAQLAELREIGVADWVVDYMQQTYIDTFSGEVWPQVRW